MNKEFKNLPDDPALLKQMLFEMHAKKSKLETAHTTVSNENSRLEEKHSLLEKECLQLEKQYSQLEENRLHLETEIDSLRSQIADFKRMLFGKRSEKLTEEELHQMFLFNEAEDGIEEKTLEELQQEKITVPAHTRKKRGRKKLSEDIPRKEIIHDLDEEEKQCPCCGKGRPCIGEEITEELDIIPQQIIVNKHIKKKYGPCTCEDFLEEEIPEVKTAKAPERFIPGSIATPGLIAYSITSKFCDALPFYRQAKIFSRFGVEISRATLCNWSLLTAEKCTGLLEVLKETTLSGPVVRMDETTVQVLKEENKSPSSNSYMWVAYGYGNEEHPLLLYQYHPTRSSDVPKEFLRNYSGFVQTDGYKGYNFSDSSYKGEITHVGCLAHARREFEKAYKANKKSKCAYTALKYIRNIYRIENTLRERNLASGKFVIKRKEQMEPVFLSFHNWLCEQKKIVLSSSQSGNAISYTLSIWENVLKFLEHHLLTPDNNLIENAIRPFAVGRKNWLFSNTPRGAKSSACFYSLIESAKANKLEPYYYLRYVFENLLGCSNKEDLRKLLPDMLTPEMITVN